MHYNARYYFTQEQIAKLKNNQESPQTQLNEDDTEDVDLDNNIQNIIDSQSIQETPMPNFDVNTNTQNPLSELLSGLTQGLSALNTGDTANIPNMPTESILDKSVNSDAGKMYLVDKNQPRVLNYLSEPTVDEKHQQQETTEQTEQPQISANLTDYITNLLDNQFNKDIQDLKITAPNEQTEETITLHGRITNTPDVVESEPVKGNPSVYLDKDGKAHRIDENGNEVKNNLSIWDNIFDKKSSKEPIRYQDAKGNWHDSNIKDNAVKDETWKYVAGAYPTGKVAKTLVKSVPYIVDSTNKTIENIKRSKELDELQDKRKDWGIAYRKASGDPDLAIETLLEKKQGFVPKAIHKDGIGDIDFVWGKGGKNGYGLAHIIDQRNSNGLNGVDFVKSLPKIIQEGKIIKTPSQKNVKFIKNGDDNAIIKLIWDEKERKWVVTSYRDYNAL